ncbi:hypothetical protein FJT64_017711 [Amphibalanus amphitrite]|uniref:Fibrinogen C-terminal domain-containing protein n=1 Tax=Amphibalanus amphitrite TaxID=1232801 RepID=A0A6A4X608_AMPAM|nr:hypothetical protein FJT64_017711 [Amphibalanus amphitrite]
MAVRRVACLLSVLTVAAALPSQQPPPADQPPPAVSYQPSAAEQLSALLNPLVEGAVSRAQCGWQLGQLAGRLERLQAGADAGHRALAELTRQQLRLDSVVHDVTALQLSVLAGGGRDGSTGTAGACRPPPQAERRQKWAQTRVSPPGTAEVSETEVAPQGTPAPTPAEGDLVRRTREQPEATPVGSQPQEAGQIQEPACQQRPAPLPGGAATYQEPAERACARSCLQLQRQGVAQDGVYWLTGLPVPVLCDFSHDDGGWTLLVTAISRQGWDPLSIFARNVYSPSLSDDYSILRYADTIRDLSTSDRFAYRIESQAEKGRQRWGGVWFAPKHYSFVDETGTQTEVSLVRRFDDWIYKGDGIKRRMPWINTGGENPYRMHPVLTTASKTEWWGTLATHHTYTRHNHSPWYNPNVVHSGTMLYWMREVALP